MITDRYRGKTRVFVLRDDPLVDGIFKSDDHPILTWLREEARGWRVQGGQRMKDDDRDFVRISFEEEVAAVAFVLNFKEADTEVNNIAYRVCGEYFDPVYADERAEIEADPASHRDDIVYSGWPRMRFYTSPRGIRYYYGVEKTLGGRYAAWRDGDVSQRRISPTKKTVIEWARKRAHGSA